MSRSPHSVLSCVTAVITVPLALAALFVLLVFGHPFCGLIRAKVYYSGTLRCLDPVIDAIERYHDDRGRYPPALCALTRDGYLHELPQLPPPFHASYGSPKDERGDGYDYFARGDSYELVAFSSRPGDHTGWLLGWTESVTYYGPGWQRGSSDGIPLGHVGRWVYSAFDD